MTLYLDANVIIYAIEGAPQFRDAVIARLAQATVDPGTLFATSRLSRLECRVKPLRDADTQLLGTYELFFANPALIVAEIDTPAIERATQLRAQHGFRTPDAIHLATAIEHKADVFLSGDASLARCPGIKVEVL